MDRIDDATRIVSRLIGKPVYAVSTQQQCPSLSAREERAIRTIGRPGTIAATNAVSDAIFQDTALRYRWRGRGCCVVFRTPPYTMTATRVLGIMVHEAAHWLDDFDNPARDDPDAERAIATFWKTMRPESEHHNRRWLRATIHLWHRAAELGHEVPLSSAIRLEQYGYGPADLRPLLTEAANRTHEPIEDILRTSPAGTRPTATTSTSTAATPKRKRRRGGAFYARGRLVRYANGRTTVDGKPVSEADLQKLIHGTTAAVDERFPVATTIGG